MIKKSFISVKKKFRENFFRAWARAANRVRPYWARITGAGLCYCGRKVAFFFQPLDVEWRASGMG
jgi:hypothetical protein